MASNIREIARVTGFSTATVSLALRDSERVNSLTRKKIKRVAKKLGYQPQPLLSKALSLIRQPEKSRYRENLAIIVEFPLNHAPDFQRELYAAVSSRARDLGYTVEPFVISGGASNHHRLSRVMKARGIRSVIFFPGIRYHNTRIYLEWSEFAVLEIGRTIRHPLNIHRVERSIYHELVEALHLLKKAGYRRIGLAVDSGEDSNRWGIYTAAFTLYQQKLPLANRLPPLQSFGPWEKDVFRRWLKQFQPDLLLIHHPQWICSWLEQLKLKWPEDISIFSTNVSATALSGLKSDLKRLGEAAVDMMSLLLDRNKIGIPKHPDSWLVRDDWQTGNSLRLPLKKGPS